MTTPNHSAMLGVACRRLGVRGSTSLGPRGSRFVSTATAWPESVQARFKVRRQVEGAAPRPPPGKPKYSFHFRSLEGYLAILFGGTALVAVVSGLRARKAAQAESSPAEPDSSLTDTGAGGSQAPVVPPRSGFCKPQSGFERGDGLASAIVAVTVSSWGGDVHAQVASLVRSLAGFAPGQDVSLAVGVRTDCWRRLAALEGDSVDPLLADPDAARHMQGEGERPKDRQVLVTLIGSSGAGVRDAVVALEARVRGVLGYWGVERLESAEASHEEARLDIVDAITDAGGVYMGFSEDATPRWVKGAKYWTAAGEVMGGFRVPVVSQSEAAMFMHGSDQVATDLGSVPCPWFFPSQGQLERVGET
jgi:hypothetical protein